MTTYDVYLLRWRRLLDLLAFLDRFAFLALLRWDLPPRPPGDRTTVVPTGVNKSANDDDDDFGSSNPMVGARTRVAEEG